MYRSGVESVLAGRDHLDENVWSAARLQEKVEGEKASLRKCIRPVMEISSPGHDELRDARQLISHRDYDNVFRSSGCGATDFRRGLLENLALDGRVPVEGHFTAQAALLLPRALAELRRVSLDVAKNEEAVRWILYDVWSNLPRCTFEEQVVPRLVGTWAGEVLETMQAHHRRREMEKQTRAEFECTAAAVASNGSVY